MLKVAALQAEYSRQTIEQAVAVVREAVGRCEKESVDILCCPEGFLGGLADYAEEPETIAIDAANGDLARVLSPLTSESVAVIVGFTERDKESKLYNSAVVYSGGRVVGIYRKMLPAIRHSIYTPGVSLPVFEINGLRFGIQICNDSNYPEQTAELVAQGARVVLSACNNALPHSKADVVALTREVDVALASDNSVYIVRSDVAGRVGELTAHGTSKIVDPAGRVVVEAGAMPVQGSEFKVRGWAKAHIHLG